MNARNFPYGCQMEKGRIIIDEEEAAQIQRIFEMRLDGVGVYAIGKMLYEEQIPFFSDTRDKAIKKVSAILYKPIYTGAKGYPAIIDNETFDKVQKMKSAPFKQPRIVDETPEEIEEEYILIHSEIAEIIKEDITQMLKNKESDSAHIRDLRSAFTLLSHKQRASLSVRTPHGALQKDSAKEKCSIV